MKRNNRAIGERSFTLLETIIALSILTVSILQLVGSQGKIVYFSTYSRRMEEATWLAQRLMAQVEYHWSNKEFKELETDTKDARFEDMGDSDYTYNIEIHEWKFPLLDFLAGNGEDDDKKGGAGGMVGDLLKQVLGTDILKIAHVEVFWPEGASRNSVDLSLLLTNQRKVDEEILKLEAAANKLDDEMRKQDNPAKAPAEPKTEVDCLSAGRVWQNNHCLPKANEPPNNNNGGSQ